MNFRNKPRRAYGVTASRVIEFFDDNRKKNSTEIGEALGLHPAYVRKTLYRRGKKLHRARA